MISNLPQHAKTRLRKIAITLIGKILRVGSRPFSLREDTSVVIAPHQDDESLGCGGFIARKRNEGLPVHVVFITDGSASHPEHPQLSSRALSSLRRQEAIRAMACLGVERNAVHFIDEPDGTLKDITDDRRANLVARLAQIFTRLAPAEIFLPCSTDGSSEHDATFRFVIDAIDKTGQEPDIWQYPVWSWWNPVLLLRRWLATNDCRRLPTEDFREAKHRAIQCYQSQIAALPPDTVAALPPDLVKLFDSDMEYLFRYDRAAKSS